MNDEEEENEESAKVLIADGVNVIIPQCCTEGWDECPHVVQKQRPDKRNVGL